MKPSLETYREQAACCDLVPVWEEWLADRITPVEAYWQLGGGPGSFLLESAEGGRMGRYSVIGLDPWLTFLARGKEITLIEAERRQVIHGDSLAVLKEVFSRYRLSADENMPRFWGGGVGYFAYDWVRGLERLPSLAADDLGLPDCWLLFPRQLVVFDHWRRSLRAVILTRPGSNFVASYQAAGAEMRLLRRRLESDLPLPPATGATAGKPCSNMTRQQFIDAVIKAKDYILAGDIFQVVLSQRWEVPFSGEPLAVYRALRYINPSPYLFYVNFGSLQLVGSSPEMLVRVEGQKVETNPIAGTRPRGATAAADRDLERELLADAKERAEHVMLVDLARNDLGRVCLAGTVRVERFIEVEKYSHVMHLVSQVQGILAPGLDALDVLGACFPAGTVSGAPKVRAMEIIEELEPVRRGPYAGAVGYVSFGGNLDTCLAIRTLVFTGGKAYVQAGAGIVAGSKPEAEYQETVNKARALWRALEMVAGEEPSPLAARCRGD